MLIAVRPGAGIMDAGAPFAAAGAMLWALYQVLVRRIGRDDPVETTILYTGLVGTLASGLWAPFAWTAPTSQSALLLLLVGVLGFAGHGVLILALRHAPASTLQPFGYVLLVWATAMGWLVFGDLPDRWTIAGAATVAASGLYAYRREQRRRG